MQGMSGETFQAWDKPVSWLSLRLFYPDWGKVGKNRMLRFRD